MDRKEMKRKNEEHWKRQTKAVRGGQTRTDFGETSEALFLTSGYVYDNADQAEDRFEGRDDGFMYSRFGNPTVSMFESRIASLEGSQKAIATATGMAAVHAALMCQLNVGDHVVSARALFGSCRYIVEELLTRFGIRITLIDGQDLNQWREAITPMTRCGFVESPSNPMLGIVDLKGVADILHEADAQLIVDNALATPILQRPIELGADTVIYSATKHIDGQGRCLGGVVLGSESFVEEKLRPYLRHTGPALSPFNAWVMLKGLETLDIRIRKHSENARIIALFLSDHSKIAKISFPGLPSHPQHSLAMRQMEAGGGLISFDVINGKEGAFRFLNALQLIDISNNLGDTKSLITHPATTTHQRIDEQERLNLGIGPGSVRLSVGLEDIDDIREDLNQALNFV